MRYKFKVLIGTKVVFESHEEADSTEAARDAGMQACIDSPNCPINSGILFETRVETDPEAGQ